MDLRCAIGQYVTQGRELLIRLRSPEEGPTVTVVDLHILRVQLFLLDHEAANMEQRKMLSPLKSPTCSRIKSRPPRTKSENTASWSRRKPRT
jgi:hypothetical protein